MSNLPSTSQYDPAIYDHPLVQELMSQIDALLKGVGEFEASAKHYAEQIKDVQGKRSDLMNSIKDQLALYNNEIQLLDQQKKQIDQAVRESLELKNKLMGEFDTLAQQVQTDQQLEEISKQWQHVKDEHDWLWVAAARDYQNKAIEFAASGVQRDLFGVGIFDQPGLGKTLEAAGAVDLIQAMDEFDMLVEERIPGFDVNLPCRDSILWVAPNAIKTSTARELAKWSGRKVVVLQGPVMTRDALVNMAYQHGFLLICSYEQLRDRNGAPVTKALFDNKWPIVVMDEAHRFKNTERSTFLNMKKIVEQSAYIIPMTGTPILNRPDELYAILHMLTLKGKKEGLFGKYSYFSNNYLNWNGTANVDRLMKSISDMVLRRKKDEVLKDLPDKLREVRFVVLSPEQRELYDSMRDKLILWLDQQDGKYISVNNFLAQLSYLRQIALLPAGVKMKGNPDLGIADEYLDCTESAKIDEAMAVIEELLDADEKVIVYSNFTAPLKEVQKRVGELYKTFKQETGEVVNVDARCIIGGVEDSTRANFADRFNDPEDSLRVLCNNIRAGGEGLNLQGSCSHAIFLDLDWSPGRNEQAEDRLHRSGQTNDVMIHIIQAEDTVDAFIALKLEMKAEMIYDTIERDELRKALDQGLI